MTLFLVRHAKAGSRGDWPGDDTHRPLTKAGRRQAEALADLLAPEAPTRILSSPYTRCVATVEPLAAKLGLRVEPHAALAEGTPFDRSWRLVGEIAGVDAVVCSHGDVIGDVLLHAVDQGVALPDHRLEKAGIWVLELEHGRPSAARYLPPPPLA